MKIKGNPTLLTLLRAGCVVTLPSGYQLVGDPETGYIGEVNIGGGDDGLRLLSKNGLAEALCDAAEDEKERHLRA